MVEFVKGKALLGAIVVLVGGLLEVLVAVQGFLNPDAWTIFNSGNVMIFLPGVVAMIFGILVILGGFLVLIGNGKGNYLAIFLGLIVIALWHFLLPPPASIPYESYIKILVDPFLYFVGGLFGLSIAEE
ncbi:MAG: hypothetical protein ACFFEF_08445 [Candidatus Thorarchaeota archaeon]